MGGIFYYYRDDLKVIVYERESVCVCACMCGWGCVCAYKKMNKSVILLNCSSL